MPEDSATQQVWPSRFKRSTSKSRKQPIDQNAD